jgi:hypothetical protein
VKCIIFGCTALVACSVALAGQQQTVVVPLDDKPFTVAKADLVRLAGKGISGSKIEIKVDGPAKVQSESRLVQVKNGKTLVGMQVKEFDLQPTNTGKVSATITVTPPQPGASVSITKFEFEVK